MKGMGKAYDILTGSIHLQSIGRHKAKPADKLIVGDHTVWNWGSTGEVVSLERRGNSIHTILKFDDGKEYPRRFKPGRMVAFLTAEDMAERNAWLERRKMTP